MSTPTTLDPPRQESAPEPPPGMEPVPAEETRNAEQSGGTEETGRSPSDPPPRTALRRLDEAALRFYDDFLSYNFIGALVVSGCFLFFLFYNYRPEKPPSIFLIATFAGALGAFVSSLMRMYNFSDLPAAFAMEKTSFRRHTMLIYSFIPAVIGTIAAAILYILFASQIVTGALFPNFTCATGKECTDIAALIDDYGPDKASDYARMIFWGFAAGFAERLVPDLVTRLAGSAAAGEREPG